MSAIEKLISQLCPEGVPYLALGEVGEFFRGRRFVKDDIRGSGVPAIHYGELYTKYSNVAYETFSFLDKDLASKLRVAKKGDVILVSAGETISDIGKSIAWLGGADVVIHDALYGYRSPLDAKYVSYFFNSANFRMQLPKYINSSKVSAISPSNLSKISIPVPPIEIQREVVQILDKFNELEAELEAELELRKTQQIHYRNHFFSKAILSKYCPNGVPEHSLGSLLIANRGGGTPSTAKPDYWDGEIPWASIGDLIACRMYISETRRTITDAGLKSGATSLVKAGDVLAAVKISPGLMKIASRDVAINQDIRGLTLDPRLDAAFLVYFFRTFSIIANGSIVKGITNATLEKVKVPVPPLEVQHEIVTALNAMNELELSLETELLARRSQYEFYRNRLLTFKELEVS